MIGLLMMLAVVQATAAQDGSSTEAFMSGNQLYELCRTDRSSCISYVEGAVDATNATLAAIGRRPAICTPTGITAGQVTDLAKLYFEKNPEKRHYSAASSVALAMIEAFPCK